PPRAVARPRTLDEVAQLVAEARRRGVSLAARGQGHSCFGQSQAGDGWVVDLGALCDMHIEGETAVMGAGAIWRDVVKTTLESRLTPPVLTDYIGLSVGGTLSVGGFGGASFRYGTQTDHVVDLSVVTGAGDVIVCSRERHASLFEAVLGGLG